MRRADRRTNGRPALFVEQLGLLLTVGALQRVVALRSELIAKRVVGAFVEQFDLRLDNFNLNLKEFHGFHSSLSTCRLSGCSSLGLGFSI